MMTASKELSARFEQKNKLTRNYKELTKMIINFDSSGKFLQHDSFTESTVDM